MTSKILAENERTAKTGSQKVLALILRRQIEMFQRRS